MPNQKGSLSILIVMILVAVSVIGGVFFLGNNNSNQFQQQTQQKEIKKTLTFISSQDKLKLHKVIDDAISLKDFDQKYYNTFADILEKNKLNWMLGAPEIYAEPLEEFSINGKNPLLGNNFTFFTDNDLGVVKRFAHIFTDEYTKYPVEWMEQINLAGVSFVKEVVSENGDRFGGIAKFIVVYKVAFDDEDFIRQLIHHEIAHIMQQRNFGRSFIDPNWPGRTDLYRQAYDFNKNDNPEYPTAGFVTNYAQTNVPEDEAEVYAYLFTSKGYKKLTLWILDDQILKGKVDYLKNFIKTKVPAMDDAYYERYVL